MDRSGYEQLPSGLFPLKRSPAPSRTSAHDRPRHVLMRDATVVLNGSVARDDELGPAVPNPLEQGCSWPSVAWSTIMAIATCTQAHPISDKCMMKLHSSMLMHPTLTS